MDQQSPPQELQTGPALPPTTPPVAPPSTPAPPPAAPPDLPPATSLASRLFNIFAAPGEVFAEIKAAPPSAANWLVPALIFITVGWIGSSLVLSQETFKHQISEMTEKAIRKQIQPQVDKGRMSKEDAEKAVQTGEKVARLMSTIGVYGWSLVLAFLSPFAWGFALWLVGAQILKGRFAYMKAVEAVGLGNMLNVLEAIVKTLLIFGTGALFASPSLALLVKDFDPQNPLHALIATADVMTIWILAVRSIALARLSGRPIWKSALWVIAIWAVLTFVPMGIGFASRTLMNAAGAKG